MSSALRIYQPDAPEPITLRHFYESSVLPGCTEMAPSTLGEHRLALHRWDQFSLSLVDRNLRTLCPEVPDIDTEMVAAFLRWMQETPHTNVAGKVGRASGRSAARSLSYVRSWIGLAAERGKGQVLGKTPPPRRKAGDHRILIPSDHVDRLMESAAVATWPRQWWRGKTRERVGQPFEPALFWRCVIVWLYVFGQRRGDLLGMKRDNRPHIWANVIDQAENPHPNGNCCNEHGWLVFTQSKTDKDLVLPIPEIPRRWLDQVAATFPDRRPQDLMLSVGRSKQPFYESWHAIAAAAGVAPKADMQMVDGVPVMKARRYEMKNFRSTAASVIETHAKVGRYVTGHAADRSPGARVDSGIFESHYLTSEQAVLNALTTLPLPPSFTDLL